MKQTNTTSFHHSHWHCVRSNRRRKPMVKRKKKLNTIPHFFLISLEIHNFIFPFVKFELKEKKRKKKNSLGWLQHYSHKFIQASQQSFNNIVNKSLIAKSPFTSSFPLLPCLAYNAVPPSFNLCSQLSLKDHWQQGEQSTDNHYHDRFN